MDPLRLFNFYKSQTNWQPIQNLLANSPFAYEALLRVAPKGQSEFGSNDAPLPEEGWFAHHDLEILRQHLVDALRAGLTEKRIFVNVEPLTLVLHYHSLSVLLEQFAEIFPLSQVTLEITERNRDVLLTSDKWRECLARCRSKGLHIALDDWAGRRPDVVIAQELQPEYIKIQFPAMHSRKAQQGPRQRRLEHLIDTVLERVHRCDAIAIVERVETARQLEMLSLRGLHYAQGYLFGKPEPMKDTREKVDHALPI